MNSKERLSRLIAQYQKNMEFYRNAREFNEQDCRDEFISPLLESFGWDVHNEKGTSPQYKEVVVEKFSNSGDRPDYTLTLNGVSKIFVEAKKPAVNIKEEQEPAIQARRYGWNAKHKLSILTNFEDMMIYDVTNKPQDGDSATVSLYRKYHYLEYLKKYEEIYELISRESVYTGKYDKYVEDKFPNEERYSTEVDEVFLKQINEWRLEIGDYLYRTDNTYKDIDVLNDVVQEFINQIIFLRICEDRNLPLYQSLKETARNNPKHLLELSNGKKKLPLTDKKDILTRCIYGVDIDVHAVEVSKFSLLIKLIEDETPASVKECVPILPDLSSNIKNGNSLICREDISGKDMSIEALCNIKPFEWSMINSGSKFDAIIGNPPYVKTEDIHTLETEAEFAVYKKKYKSAYKQFDKYFLFLEEAFNLLKENGQMCYIVPNKFYKIGAGQELRRIISKHVSKLDDFGDMQLFPDKTIYSCIITLCKESSKQMEYTNVTSLIDLWTGEEQESIRIKNELLDENPWRLTTDIKFMKMIATVEENGKPLGEIVNIFNGIQTSAERPKPVYWFSKDEIVSEKEDEIIVDKFEKRYHIEKRILKPFFKPTKADEKGMGTYSLLKTDKHIIFPYNADGSLINVEIMKKEYPGTYQYLQDCYDLLVPKCLNGGKGRDIKNATADTWYQYGRTQALTAFVNTPKLIVRILSKEPMYAYDENDMLIASGGTAGYCAIAKLPDSKYDLRYIQAWLNHPYTEKLFQIMGSDFEGGFIARGTYLLKKIPFVELDFDDEKQKALYESVLTSTKKINELNIVLEQKKDKASISVIEAEKENLSKQIEDNITKIYNLQF